MFCPLLAFKIKLERKLKINRRKDIKLFQYLFNLWLFLIFQAAIGHQKQQRATVIFRH